MARIPFPIYFGGGLNDTASDFDIGDTQASDLLNCHFDEVNTLVKRDGSTLYGNDVGSLLPLGLGKYIYVAGASITRSVYVVLNGAVNGDVYLYVAGTWTAQGRTLTNNTNFQLVQANNELYTFNGTDAVQNLSNTTWSSLASGVPLSGANTVGYYARYHNNMMFVARTNNNPSRVYVSALGDPENFTGGYTVDINIGDGDPITGIEIIGNYIAVFKPSYIALISGYSPDDLSVIEKSTDHGAISTRSIVLCNGVILFQDRDGHIYSFDTASVVQQSGLINTTIEGLNTTYYEDSAGVYFQNKYHLAVADGSSTKNNKVLVLDLLRSSLYDPNQKVWAVYDGIQASDWLVARPSGNKDKLYFCESAADSKVYEMYSGTSDNGVAINFYYTTKNFSVEDNQRDKKLKYLYVNAEAVGDWNLTVSYSIDGSTSFANLGTISLAAGGWVLGTSALPVTLSEGFLGIDNTLVIPAAGRYVRFKFTQAGLSQTCRIYNATMYFRYGKLRKRLKTA